MRIIKRVSAFGLFNELCVADIMLVFFSDLSFTCRAGHLFTSNIREGFFKNSSALMVDEVVFSVYTEVVGIMQCIFTVVDLL
jgi:hypothetical protein